MSGLAAGLPIGSIRWVGETIRKSVDESGRISRIDPIAVIALFPIIQWGVKRVEQKFSAFQIAEARQTPNQ
jgi:hypothetical protein